MDYQFQDFNNANDNIKVKNKSIPIFSIIEEQQIPNIIYQKQQHANIKQIKQQNVKDRSQEQSAKQINTVQNNKVQQPKIFIRKPITSTYHPKQQQQVYNNKMAKTETIKLHHQHEINPQETLYNLNKQAFINYTKAHFIMTQILDVIEADTLLNYKEESHVEFLFLLSIRVNNYLKKVVKFLSGCEKNQSIIGIVQDINAYYAKSSCKYKIYSKMLDQILGQFGYKISRLFTKGIKNKQLFLDAIQDVDYTAEQQVQFTHKNYIQIVLNSTQIKNPYFKNHRLKKILKGYKAICEIQAEDIKNQRQLKNKIDQIILDQ